MHGSVYTKVGNMWCTSDIVGSDHAVVSLSDISVLIISKYLVLTCAEHVFFKYFNIKALHYLHLNILLWNMYMYLFRKLLSTTYLWCCRSRSSEIRPYGPVMPFLNTLLARTIKQLQMITVAFQFVVAGKLITRWLECELQNDKRTCINVMGEVHLNCHGHCTTE